MERSRIRPGRAPSRALGGQLDRTHGRAQAAELAAALSGCRVELQMTFAVPRAIETAAILAAGMCLAPVVKAG